MNEWMNEHVNDYTLIRIRIVAADSIRDSIRTKISDSQVPTTHLCSPDLPLRSFKRQLKCYLFPHWGCQVPEQPSGAIVTVQRIWRRI